MPSLPPVSARSASACCWSISAPPTAADARGVRVYLKEFLSDPQGDRKSGADLEAGAERHHPAGARPAARRATTRRSGTPRRTSPRSRPSRARSPTSWRRRSRTTTMSSSIGRCATAIRRSRSRIAALTAQGCDRLLVVPLYPQYSAATSATVCDEVFRVLAGMRAQPTLRVTPPYYDDRRIYRRAGGLDRRASQDRCRFSRR